MSAKSLVHLSAAALVAFISFASSAQAQRWRYDDGYGGGYGYRPRCLSSDGINESLAQRGLYPRANVGSSPDGRVLHMQVSRGPQIFVVAVDGCTGRILRGGY